MEISITLQSCKGFFHNSGETRVFGPTQFYYFQVLDSSVWYTFTEIKL